MRIAAVQAGVDVRFGTELVSAGEGHDGVDARLLSHRTGRRFALTARYLIAADGSRSLVREMLGITRSTNGFVGLPNVNVYFSADLAEVVRGREFNLCQITNPDAPGALASVDGRRRWVFMSPGADVERDWPGLLRRALGVTAPRVPHRWLDPEHSRSTIDLAGPGWAILAGPDVTSIPVGAGDPIVVVCPGDGIDFLDRGELVLLRPDHVIAWRGTALREALNALRAIL